jgi:Asp-tRNA(Asn)/Glu-tRNA(Gln) amidotransferase A subunit family amidase
MPVGLQLMASGHEEDRLLAAALAVERALGFEMPVPARFAA